MPDTLSPLSFLALIPGCDTDVAAACALMGHVRQLADGRGAGAHVLLAGTPATREASLAAAHAARLDHAWFIPVPAPTPPATPMMQAPMQEHAQTLEHAPMQVQAPTLAQAPMQEHASTHAWVQTLQYVDLFASALQSEALAGLLPSALMLVGAQADNEAFAGALAARLGAVPLGRCTELEFDAEDTLHATRGGYGNRLRITLAGRGAMIAAIRPKARAAAKGVAHAPASATTAPPTHAPASAATAPPTDAPASAMAAAPAATTPSPARPTSTQRHVLDNLPPPRAGFAITPLPRNEPHAALDGARIVVAGGRGMGNDLAFPMLYDIAAKLGGAVGASLPAVDAGWAPVTRQVGISGKYVSPDTYLAIGISGTPQHLAGIDPHTRIVAVNKDPEANIFSVAQAGAVAEWQALLPALLSALDQPGDT